MTPQLTITAGRLAIAVVGIPTVAAGTSAVILAVGATTVMVGGGIYLAKRHHDTKLSPPSSKKLK